MEYEGMWETPEIEFSTKNRFELVEKINELLFVLKPYQDKRILLQPGIVDKPNEAIRQELLTNGLTPEVVTKIIECNHKALQDLILDYKKIDKCTIEKLAQHGASKGVKAKAKQLLNKKH